MKIFPAIDLKNGKCVRLTKGDFKSEKIYNENPINQAEIFSNAGFEYLHIIDLDGALEGNLVNLKTIEEIQSRDWRRYKVREKYSQIIRHRF